jgi:hypothetical protein
MSSLILKLVNASCPSGEWRDDDYDVLENGLSSIWVAVAIDRCHPSPERHQARAVASTTC